MMRYGRSRLFKVIEIGTNRKLVCDVLSAASSNVVVNSYLPPFARQFDAKVGNRLFYCL